MYLFSVPAHVQTLLPRKRIISRNSVLKKNKRYDNSPIVRIVVYAEISPFLSSCSPFRNARALCVYQRYPVKSTRGFKPGNKGILSRDGPGGVLFYFLSPGEIFARWGRPMQVSWLAFRFERRCVYLEKFKWIQRLHIHIFLPTR